MTHVDKTLFDSLSVEYNGEKYNVISYDNIPIDEIINQIDSSRNLEGKYNISILFEIKNELKIKEIITPNQINLSKTFFNSIAKENNGLISFNNLDCQLFNSEILFGRYKRIETVNTFPYHYPYEFMEVIHFSQGHEFNVSAILQALYECKLFDTSFNAVKNYYDAIIEEFNLPIDFDKILSFEDFYELKHKGCQNS